MKYVAFLRGVSPMNAPSAKLKDVFDTLGFSNVETVISSGNVIFESSEKDTRTLERAIENTLSTVLNLGGSTIVKDIDQIRQMVIKNPFKNQTHSARAYLTVTFFKDTPTKTPDDAYSLPSSRVVTYLPEARALFMDTDTTVIKGTQFMTKLEREFGKQITTRTWHTILRIHRRMGVTS